MIFRQILTKCCVTFSVLFCLVMIPTAWGQEASPASEQESSANSAPATDEPKAQKEETPEPEPPSVSEQIRAHLKASRPAKAAKVLADALESDPDNVVLRNFHRIIASGFIRTRKYDLATDQLMKAFEYQYPKTDSPTSAQSLASTVQQLNMFYFRGNQAAAIAKINDETIERCREIESKHPTEVQLTLARLIAMRASLLSREDKDAALKLLSKQIAELNEINSSDDRTEETVSAAINLLTTKAGISGDPEVNEQVDKMLQQALESYPESQLLVGQYANNEYLAIRRLSMDNPEKASKRMESAIEKLTHYAEEMRGVQSTLGRIESLERRIESTRKQLAMIGEDAPPLDINGWANTESFDADDLKGKVVLYDFWAVWCGPCIATFPHLREWREEFGEDGFEIVGVTRYYGYSWDDEKGVAVRGGAEVEPEAEHEAVGKFLQSKDMKHPTIFTPKESTLQKEYLVSGIPHAVLVDREGKIQMIKVGNRPENAEALHGKIKELIAN